MKRELAIVMPVFNEAEGIEEFINEIRFCFRSVNPMFITIDDCSTDATWLVLSEMKKKSDDLILAQNQVNLGHGQSTIRALKLGLLEKPKYIMSVDGDGQFLGNELLNFYKTFSSSNSNYAEGNRINRQDPWFRKFISLVTRVMVLAKSGKKSIDANTPVRIYKAETLENLIENIENTSLVPNLRMSIIVRKIGNEIFTFNLSNIPRRGSSSQGSSWGSGGTILPSRRLFKFCKKAIKEFL